MQLVQTAKTGIANRDASGTADALDAGTADHTTRFVTCYGVDVVMPKFHYQGLIPKQVRRDGVLFDAFTGERKNSSGKAASQAIENTKTFERTVMSRAIVCQIAALSERGALEDGLLGATRLARELTRILPVWGDAVPRVSRRAKLRGYPVMAGDCVFYGADLLQISVCVAVNTSATSQWRGVIAELCLYSTRVTSFSRRFRRTGEFLLFEGATGFTWASAWTFPDDAHILALI